MSTEAASALQCSERTSARPAPGGKTVEDRVVGREPTSARGARFSRARRPRHAEPGVAPRRRRRRPGNPGGPPDLPVPAAGGSNFSVAGAPRGSTSAGRDTAVAAPPSLEARATTAPAGMGTSASRGRTARSRRPEARLTSSSERIPGGAATATRPPGSRRSRSARVRAVAAAHHDPFVGRESESLERRRAPRSSRVRSAAARPAERRRARAAGDSGTRQTRQGTSRRGSPASQRKESVSPSAAASAAASRRGRLTREA